MKPYFLLSPILIMVCLLSGNPQEPQIDLNGYEIDGPTAQKLIGKYVELKDGQISPAQDRMLSEFTLEPAQVKGKALIFQMVKSAGLDTKKIYILREYPEDDPEEIDVLNYIVLKSKLNEQPYILTEAVNSTGPSIRFYHIEFENDAHLRFYFVHPKGIEELVGKIARIR